MVLSKLASGSKEFDMDSEAGEALLGSLWDVCVRQADMTDESTLSHGLRAGNIGRLIESLASVTSFTKVKNILAQRPDVLQAIGIIGGQLSDSGQSGMAPRAWFPAAFGFAVFVGNLSVSNQSLQEEKIAESEVSSSPHAACCVSLSGAV